MAGANRLQGDFDFFSLKQKRFTRLFFFFRGGVWILNVAARDQVVCTRYMAVICRGLC